MSLLESDKNTDNIKSLSYGFKKTFQIVMNYYRKYFCKGKARPLELGEIHYLCGNFIGPNTNIQKFRDFPAYNNIDAVSRLHDIDYHNASFITDTTHRKDAIRKADEDFLKNIEPFKNEEYYNIAKYGITSKNIMEKLFPDFAKKILGKERTG
jgi:hypothetical protein